MKKIIEAAEQICELRLKYNSDTLSRNFCDVIDERKELEQTPITEEWLKAHGFVQNIYWSFKYSLVMDDGRTEIHYYRSVGEPDSTMSIHKNIDLENEVCYELPEPYTAAQMLDACELCGIELE